MRLTDKQHELMKTLCDPEATDVLAAGGSRSGKTFALVRAVLVRAVKTACSNHAILRRYSIDAKQKIGMSTLPDVVSKCFQGANFPLDRSNWVMTLPNKARIWIGGLDDKERAEKILGAEYSTIYIDEVSQVAKESVQMARTRLAEKNDLRKVMYLSCNPPLKSHWTYNDFVKDPKPGYRLVKMNPGDNLQNIDSNFIARLEQLSERERLRFLHGEWQDAVEGALWQMVWIEEHRAELHSSPDKIILSIDPAITSGEDSDETGMIVEAKSGEDYYILADLTQRVSPAKWADAAAKAVLTYNCDRVVVEGNQGGDAWEALLINAGVTVKIETINVTHSKLSRAEPVAALYERGKVHHITDFPDLETELITYDGTGKSPNRLDALVMGISSFEGTGKNFISPGFSGGTTEEWESL